MLKMSRRCVTRVKKLFRRGTSTSSGKFFHLIRTGFSFSYLSCELRSPSLFRTKYFVSGSETWLGQDFAYPLVVMFRHISVTDQVKKLSGRTTSSNQEVRHRPYGRHKSSCPEVSSCALYDLIDVRVVNRVA